MDWLLFLGIGIVVGILVGVAATLYMVADKDDDDDCGDCCDCGDGGYCDEC